MCNVEYGYVAEPYSNITISQLFLGQFLQLLFCIFSFPFLVFFSALVYVFQIFFVMIFELIGRRGGDH